MCFGMMFGDRMRRGGFNVTFLHTQTHDIYKHNDHNNHYNIHTGGVAMYDYDVNAYQESYNVLSRHTIEGGCCEDNKAHVCGRMRGDMKVAEDGHTRKYKGGCWLRHGRHSRKKMPEVQNYFSNSVDDDPECRDDQTTCFVHRENALQKTSKSYHDYHPKFLKLTKTIMMF